MNDPAAHAAAAPTRNLLIFNTPDKDDISDWLKIKKRIEETAADIDVRVANNGAPNSVTRRWQTTRPSLVFCAAPLVGYQPRGGIVYSGRPITKLEQIERLERQGLPVPPTLKLTPDLALDPASWSPYVVAKPIDGARGEDVRLVPTHDIAKHCEELTLGGRRQMVVQPYIDHSVDGYPTEYRVLTLFGRVLYAARNRWGKARPPLETIASDPKGVIASNDKTFGRVRTISNDADVIALGERARRAFPDCALLGVDIIREQATGKLYILEVNPEGLTWHFSHGPSSLAKRTFTAEHLRDLYAQFGALERAAELLVLHTRAEAV